MNQINLLMSNLWVREGCGVPTCSGHGHITRPATVEEVREFLEYAFAKGDGFSYLRRNDEWIFELKSGAILFMKEKDD